MLLNGRGASSPPDVTSAEINHRPGHSRHYREDDGEGFNLEREVHTGMKEEEEHRDEITPQVDEAGFAMMFPMEENFARK